VPTRAATCCLLCARRCWRCHCPRTFDCRRRRVGASADCGQLSNCTALNDV
jgi:hypothetical protein